MNHHRIATGSPVASVTGVSGDVSVSPAAKRWAAVQQAIASSVSSTPTPRVASVCATKRSTVALPNTSVSRLSRRARPVGCFLAFGEGLAACASWRSRARDASRRLAAATQDRARSARRGRRGSSASDSTLAWRSSCRSRQPPVGMPRRSRRPPLRRRNGAAPERRWRIALCRVAYAPRRRRAEVRRRRGRSGCRPPRQRTRGCLSTSSPNVLATDQPGVGRRRPDHRHPPGGAAVDASDDGRIGAAHSLAAARCDSPLSREASRLSAIQSSRV